MKREEKLMVIKTFKELGDHFDGEGKRLGEDGEGKASLLALATRHGRFHSDTATTRTLDEMERSASANAKRFGAQFSDKSFSELILKVYFHLEERGAWKS